MFPRSAFPSSAFPVSAFPSAGGTGGSGALFTEVGVTNFRAAREDDSLYVEWDSTWPDGTWYQVYVNNQLVDSVNTKYVSIPGVGLTSGQVKFDIGRVSAGDRFVDFSALLTRPPGSGSVATLDWIGGRWLDPDLSGFRVYGQLVADGPINFAKPVATVAAQTGGVWGDGFGRGPFGRGPFGRGVVRYEWQSDPLKSGSWCFNVRSIDSRGNESTPGLTGCVTVAAPPHAVPADANGRRLTILSYDPVNHVAILTWKAST